LQRWSRLCSSWPSRHSLQLVSFDRPHKMMDLSRVTRFGEFFNVLGDFLLTFYIFWK
jgi:hypothetical protein